MDNPVKGKKRSSVQSVDTTSEHDILALVLFRVKVRTLTKLGRETDHGI
jgi:hypothetical protein